MIPDLLVVMWNDIDQRRKFGEVVRALEEIKKIILDEEIPSSRDTEFRAESS